MEGAAVIRTFDITPDGRHIVFDRQRENSDIVLIDLPNELSNMNAKREQVERIYRAAIEPNLRY